MMLPWPSRAFWVPCFLILATVVTRWPFRTQYLFMWDSANFALALDHYDVTQHRPHPPGYFFFVAVGRLLLPLAGDANAALVVEALGFSALATVALYLLGRTMYNEQVGLWAALLLLGSVTFWSFGDLALAYTSLAFFSTLVALLAYHLLFLKEDRLLTLAGVYGLTGGFRPDLMVFLGPLFALCLLRSSWHRGATALGVAALASAAWLVPTVALSGGIASYLAVLSAYSGTDVLDRYSVLRRGVPALINNTGDTIAYTFYALYGTVLLLPGAALGWIAATARRTAPERGGGWKAGFLALWIAPMFLFYLVIHIGYAGYVFSFLPAVLLALARGWSLVPWETRRRGLGRALPWGGIAAVLALNTVVFLFHPRLLTAPGLRASDAAIAARLALVRETDPERTVLVSYDSLKHLDYYLPTYHKSIWVDIFSPGERRYPLPSGATQLLLVDASLVAIAGELPGEEIPLAGAERAKRVPLPASGPPLSLVYRPGALRLAGP